METNEFILRLTGKASLPEPLDLGKNYEVKISGSITSVTEADNQNGTSDVLYKFEPVKIEVITELGKTIKGKDTRKMSQKLRAYLYKSWESDPGAGFDSEAYHDLIYKQIFLDLEDIIARATRKPTS